MMTDICSPVIRVPASAIRSLDSLIESTKNQVGFHRFLKLVKSFIEYQRETGDKREFFEINELLSKYQQKRSSIYRYLRMLRDHSRFVTLIPAHDCFNVSDPRLQCYEFLCNADYPETPFFEPATKGRAAQKYITTVLEQSGVDDIRAPLYSPSPITLESLYGTDYELMASNCTLPPANIISERREGKFYQYGKKQTALATSVYGVFNEEDEDVLRRIQDITIDYLKFKKQKGEIDDLTDLSKVLIPIWIEDIAERQGLSRGPSVLRSINHSIIRAYHTNKQFTHIEKTANDEEICLKSHLQLINKFHIINPNKTESKGQLKENATTQDRINHDYDKPFKLCVITWQPGFYDRLQNISAYGIAHPDLPKLPLMIRRLYEKVRQEHYSDRRKYIQKSGYGEANILELIQDYWIQVKDKNEALILSHELVKALRLILKPKGANKDLYQNILLKNISVDGNENHRVVELDVFGITMGFEITNINGYRDSQRVNDKVYFQVFNKELIEESGATYRNGGNNKPMLTNEFYESQSSRHMPDSLKVIERMASSIQISKYFMVYEVNTKAWLISPYMSANEIENIAADISNWTHLPEIDVRTYLALKMDKMLVIPHIKPDQIAFLSRQENVEPRYVVEFLTKRIAFLSDEFKQTQKLVTNKFQGWYQEQKLTKIV